MINLKLFCRTHSRAILACGGFFSFIFLISSSSVQTGGGSLRSAVLSSKGVSSGVHWGGAAHPGYFSSSSNPATPNVFPFAMVTDMDQLSVVTQAKKPLFNSKLLAATLTYNPSTATYSVAFSQEAPRILTSAHNEAGRGMELSEMTLYQNRLLAFDDRTGIVYEILSEPDTQGTKSLVVPRYIITEGEGDTDKGMKWEWATVKGDHLYIGSMGKEYTNPDGSVANTNNLWISTICPAGQVTRIDWTEQYTFVREALGAAAPGYAIHEAVLWSEHLKKWVFTPRRVSQTTYDENADERMGANKIVLVDENFTTSQVIDIQFGTFLNDGLHGFSTIAFVPGTNDKHVLAVRSVEEDCVGGIDDVCKQRSYVTVFNILTGVVLMDEIQVGLDVKFEGIEFVDITTPGP